MDCEMPAPVRLTPPVIPLDTGAGHRMAAATAFSSPEEAIGAGAPVQGSDAEGTRGTVKCRRQVGMMGVEMRHYAQRTVTEHCNSRRRALLLVPLQGELEVRTGTLNSACPAGVPLLLAHDEPAAAFWSEQSRGLVIDIARDSLSAAAGAVAGEARRLASAACILGDRAQEDGFDAALGGLLAHIACPGVQHRADSGSIESHFYGHLAKRLLGQPARDALLVPVRSVSEAIRIIREDPRREFDTEALAARAGVTAQTLRKGFRSCLGLSVKAFIQTVRLDWAYGTLSSAFDGRPIEVIAKDAGFSGAPPFSRAYVKRFGEPPSLTRGRAVRAATG